MEKIGLPLRTEGGTASQPEESEGLPEADGVFRISSCCLELLQTRHWAPHSLQLSATHVRRIRDLNQRYGHSLELLCALLQRLQAALSL